MRDVLHLPPGLFLGLGLARHQLAVALELGRRPEGLVDAVAGQDLGDDLPAVLVQVVREEGEHVVLLVVQDFIILQDGQEGVGDEGGIVGTALYYDLATDAKIPMMPSCFMEIDGIKHFLTERFDRKGGKKILTQTLAAIDPDADSYEDLFRTCRKLDIPLAEMTNLFRQTVFNFLMNNTDDHKKNFSFMMDENYKWHLTPAYDLMFIIADNAVSPERTHCMSLRGKYTGITEDDLIQFAIQNDIKAPESIINDIRNVSLKFEEYAHANGINGYYTEMISMTLNELGRAKDLHIEKVSTRIGDTELRDIQFEMTTKGNIHLLATIHNKRRKVVITSSKPLYKEIVDNGFNLMSRDKKAQIFQQAFSKLITSSPGNNSSENTDGK